MNKKLLAGLAAAGILASGGSATAVAAVGAPAAATSSAAVVSSTSRPGCGSGPLESLVAKGTITQAQAIAIHDGFISYLHDRWRNILDTVLGKLVKNRTITQAQASAVTTEITQWTQTYHGGGSGHDGPCQHAHGMGMMGGSGNR